MSKVHPSSILNLSETPVWHLLIDETGSRFNSKALELPSRNHQVGRIVGLLQPENIELPPLPPAFHATENSPFEVHQHLKQLLSHKEIGILGATVQLSELEGHSWINSVHHLVRWVLALIPASGQPLTLKVFIEQRAPYRQGDDLRALSDTLREEMKTLSPQRLCKLNLDFKLIAKTGHAHNGYVDSLAYVWGSPKPVNRKFIEETGLLGGCLVESDSHLLERLFLTIQHQHKLTPIDWYEIASTAPANRKGTILAESLQKVHERCRTDELLWGQYFDVCANQLSQKTYHPHALLHATSWLTEAQPKNIGAIQQLQLLNIRLAAANHLGKSEPALAGSAIQLARKLFDENAPLACQTVLRTIVMHCNRFDFQGAKALLEEWLEFPIAVIGKKNHGKLLSSMGQIYAFMNNAGADHFFQEALSIFEGLQDPVEAEREIKQTRNYRLIWLMDQAEENRDELVKQLCITLSTESELGLRKLAIQYASGAQNDRFDHYLLLRACIKHPETMKHVARAYWSQQQQWQSQSAHPWQLIALYRGMLIWLFSHQYASATPWIQQAISLANDNAHSGVLHRMAAVITDLHEQMLTSESPAVNSPEAFVNGMSHELPFTFH